MSDMILKVFIYGKKVCGNILKLNAPLTGILGAKRVKFPSAVACYALLNTALKSTMCSGNKMPILPVL